MTQMALPKELDLIAKEILDRLTNLIPLTLNPEIIRQTKTNRVWFSNKGLKIFRINIISTIR